MIGVERKAATMMVLVGMGKVSDADDNGSDWSR
jgi:hypothetical protein